MKTLAAAAATTSLGAGAFLAQAQLEGTAEKVTAFVLLAAGLTATWRALQASYKSRIEDKDHLLEAKDVAVLTLKKEVETLYSRLSEKKGEIASLSERNRSLAAQVVNLELEAELEKHERRKDG